MLGSKKILLVIDSCVLVNDSASYHTLKSEQLPASSWDKNSRLAQNKSYRLTEKSYFRLTQSKLYRLRESVS
jgi:hypothetical protein